MSTNWSGILICDEFKHIRNEKVIFEKYNIKNLLHIQGEDQLLRALFKFPLEATKSSSIITSC